MYLPLVHTVCKTLILLSQEKNLPVPDETLQLDNFWVPEIDIHVILLLATGGLPHEPNTVPHHVLDILTFMAEKLIHTLILILLTISEFNISIIQLLDFLTTISIL